MLLIDNNRDYMNTDLKYLAFDFDGVLADSRDLAIDNINKISRDHFPELPIVSSQEDLTYFFSGPLKTSLNRFGLSERQIKIFFDLHSKLMLSNSSKIKVFNKAVECFARIPPERKAIVTSAYSTAVKKILSSHIPKVEIDKFPIYGRELNLKKSKKFELISAKENLNKKNILKIGDMVSDILYAREYGIPVGVTAWGYHPPSYLSVFQPDYIFNNQVELEEFLKNIGSINNY